MSIFKNNLFETETDIKLEPSESFNSNKETSWSLQDSDHFSGMNNSINRISPYNSLQGLPTMASKSSLGTISLNGISPRSTVVDYDSGGAQETDYFELRNGRHVCTLMVRGEDGEMRECQRSYVYKKSWKRHVSKDHLQLFRMLHRSGSGCRKYASESPRVPMITGKSPSFDVAMSSQHPMICNPMEFDNRVTDFTSHSSIESTPSKSNTPQNSTQACVATVTREELVKAVVKEVVLNFTSPRQLARRSYFKLYHKLANQLQVHLEEDEVKRFVQEEKENIEKFVRKDLEQENVNVFIRNTFCCRYGITVMATQASFVSDEAPHCVLLDVSPCNMPSQHTPDFLMTKILDKFDVDSVVCVVIDKFHHSRSSNHEPLDDDDGFHDNYSSDREKEARAVARLEEFYRKRGIPTMKSCTIHALEAVEAAFNREEVTESLNLIEELWRDCEVKHDCKLKFDARKMNNLKKRVQMIEKNQSSLLSGMSVSEGDKALTAIRDLSRTFRFVEKFSKCNRAADLKPGGYFLHWNRLLFCCLQAEGIFGKTVAEEMMKREDFLYDRNLLAAAYFDRDGLNAMEIRDCDEQKPLKMKEEALRACVEVVKSFGEKSSLPASFEDYPDFERIEDDPDDAFDAKLNQIKRRRLEESHKSENVIMQAIGRLEASRENLEPCDVTENILSFPPLLRKPALTSACLPVCGVDATKLYEAMHNLPRCLDGFVQGGFLSDVFFLRMSFDDSEKEE